jgi:hypothetical protein
MIKRLKHRPEGNVQIDLRKRTGRTCGLDISGLGYGQLAGCYEDGNRPSGSIKCA